MGGCVCKSEQEVAKDPAVVMYTTVGSIVLQDHQGSRPLSGPLEGLLYVRQDQLCYETTVRGKRWCRCFKRRWDLVQVKHMTVVRSTQAAHSKHHHYRNTNKSPAGLKISLRTHLGYGQSLVISMPDAEGFSTLLANHINAVPR